MVEFFPAFYDGKRQNLAEGGVLDAVNPATGKVIGTFPRCGKPEAEVAVQSACRAFKDWREMHPIERAKYLLKFANLLETDRERLLELDVRDNGSPIREMAIDLDVGTKHLRYYAGLALEVRGETIQTGHDRLDYTLRQPFGVVASIIPFNHPLMFALKTIGAPLVAGNCVIVKPSEITSLSALALAEHIEAIFPPGVLSVLPGLGSEAGEALVKHPLVRRIHFIGGDRTGRRIQAQAAEVGIKSITLELGGKNPIAIWPDADMDAAINGVIAGMRFNFQGQACGSTSRLLLHKDINADFIDRLTGSIGQLRTGMPEDRSTDVGAIVSENQMKRVLDYIALGHEAGGTLRSGGRRLIGGELENGFFVSPTLFSDIAPDARIAREEIFGPVLVSMKFADYNDLIAICNSVDYGLSASLFTRDLNIAHRFARDVDAGYVWINDNQRHFVGAPYGGNKNSGLGREENVDEIASYTELKNINIKLNG